MRARMEQLKSETFAAEREWTVDDIPVLTASLALPRPVPVSGGVARRIDRYYQLYCRSYFRYCEHWLFPKAAEDYRAALQGSAPLPQYSAALSYRVTYNENGLWSLYTDSRECCGGHAELLRRGDTWDLNSGYPLPLSAFFPRHAAWKKKLCACAEAEITRQTAAGLACYHEGWRRELKHSFNSENFYLTPQGLAFFYQMYAIAPAVEGVPVFCLPFGENGCRLPEDHGSVPPPQAGGKKG